MTKIVDVHTFDKVVQNNVNRKYDNIDFNGDFDIEFQKWNSFLIKLTKNTDATRKYKIFEMMNTLKTYRDNTYIPNTNTKLATLFQMLISKLNYLYNNDKAKFSILWGYFEEFYGEELSTHCVEGVSNRAYFILELYSDYDK